MLCAGSVLLGAVTDIYAVVIPSDTLRDAVVSYVIENEDSEDIELEVTVPRVFDVEVESTGEPTFNVSHSAARRRGRNFPVTVDIKDGEGEVIRTVRLIARLKTLTDAAVLINDVRRGEKVTPEDITLKKVDVTSFDDYYDSIEPVVGKAAKRQLRAGTVIRPTHLRDPYLVKRGDRVTVEIRESDFVVQAEGTARDNGCMGDEINVLINMTKTVVTCLVIGPDTVIAGGRS